MSDFSSPKKGSNIICRVANATPEMVCKYVQRLPKQKMSEAEFRQYMGKSWFQNEHQAPEQWGLYYIDGQYYYPRFNRDITIEEAEAYLFGWIKRLIVINPYTRFKTSNDNRLVESIVKQLEENPNEHDLKTIIENIIKSNEPLVVNEIIANALNSFSEVLAVKAVDKDNEKYDVSLLPNYKEIIKTKYNMTKKEYFDLFNDIDLTSHKNQPLQQIFYGAPGTGKSHEIQKQTAGKNVIRTTFHPDSDYSTFVGAYKPTMKVESRYGLNGANTILMTYPSGAKNGQPIEDNRIEYCFVPQAFLKAYLNAWKLYADPQGGGGSTASASSVVLTYANDEWALTSVGNQNVSYDKITRIPLSNFEKTIKKFWDWMRRENNPSETKSKDQTDYFEAATCKWYYAKHQTIEDTPELFWDGVLKELKENDKITFSPFSDNKSYDIALKDDEIIAGSKGNAGKGTIKEVYDLPGFYSRQGSVQYAVAKKLLEYGESSFEDAWKRLKEEVDGKGGASAASEGGNRILPQFLVIEEINRGNCAQIFGDLFQLLDRAGNGFSEYPIEADTDLQQEIKRAFEENGPYKLNRDINIEGAVEGYTSNYGSTLSKDVQEGRILLLPPNLFIWATMNTSDQSLFPIDSAFKRRWDWKYMPIEDAGEGWKIVVNEHEYDWYEFLTAINKEIYVSTHSEDKQLGYFFAKAKGGVIDAETLVNKVYFYLWTDVFKDYDYESQKVFRKPEGKGTIAFKDFFEKGQEIDQKMAEQLIINLKTSKSEESAE